MIKKYCVFMSLICISMISFSQTIKENIEKQSKDPKTIENAAKADVFILGNKKKISDTATVQTSFQQSDKSRANTRKKKHCRKSSK